MRALVTNAPAGLNYQLQSTNQGDLEVEVSESEGGGGAFTDSVNAGIVDLATPVVAELATAPGTFTSVVATGWLSIIFVNNESSAIEASGTVTFEISTDSGVTWSSIGDPLGYTMQNPSTANVQQGYVNVFFTTRATGPATGSVQLRATIADETTGGAFAGGQFTATGVFVA